MSNMIYPLEKRVGEQIKYSDPKRASDLSLAEIRVSKTLTIKAWPDTSAAVNKELSGLLGEGNVPNVGKWVKSGNLICVCSTPGQFILMTDDPGFDVSIEADIAAVTDVSHSRCGLMISGAKTHSLLNKGLAFPLDDKNLPVGSFTQGSIHSIGVLIFKMNEESTALFFYNSFAISMFEWVIDSALEYGYALSDRPLSLIEQ